MSKDFNSFFKELVQERIDEVPCPPKDTMWKKLIVQLRIERKKEKRKRLLNRLKPVIAACIIVAFIAILYAIPQTQVMAFTNKIIKNIIIITEDTIKIYKKVDNESDKTNDYLFGREIDDPRIGEAQKKIHFRLLIPEYIPKDFKLNNVDVLNKYEKKETVTFLYLHSNSDNKECFEIMQQSFPNGSDVTLNIKKDENTKIEKLTVDGIEYTFLSYEKKLSGILWDGENISYEINGNLTKDEIIKVAKSMK